MVGRWDGFVGSLDGWWFFCFPAAFQAGVDALGLSSLRLTPSSLRAGGATYLFAQGLELGRLKFRGRWASLTTLEHYVQEASASLVLLSLPPDQVCRLEAIARAGSKFEEPPTVPWTALFSRARQVPLRHRRHGSVASSVRR